MLLGAEIGVTVIDNDAEMIDVAARFGMKVYFGDGTRLELLRQAGADEARAIVFAMDRDQLSREELDMALKSFRQAAVFVRAYDRRALVDYGGLDTAGVVREVFESAVLMGRRLLTALGHGDNQVAVIEADYRTRDKARLRIQVEKGLYAEEARKMSYLPGQPISLEESG
jgi:glutathione-regulated potassium-efflux system protein KefB